MSERIIHHQKTVAASPAPPWRKVGEGVPRTKTLTYRVVVACTGEPPDDTKNITQWLQAVTCPACQALWVEHVLTP